MSPPSLRNFYEAPSHHPPHRRRDHCPCLKKLLVPIGQPSTLVWPGGVIIDGVIGGLIGEIIGGVIDVVAGGG